MRTLRHNLLAARPAALVVALGGVVAIGAVVSGVAPGVGAALLQHMIAAVRHAGAGGAVLFLFLAIGVGVSGVLPAAPLCVAAGTVFGLLTGFLLAAGGLLTGAALAFRLSRSAFRPAIERMLASRWRLHSLDAAVTRYDWKFVLLIRLSPVVPFSAMSYLLGLSSVRFPGYLVGTLAALPALFAYVFCGTLTGAGILAAAGGDNPIRWLTLGVGAAATLLLVVLLSRCLARCVPLVAPGDGGA